MRTFSNPRIKGVVLETSIALTFSVHAKMTPDKPDVDQTVSINRERGLNLSSNEQGTNT